MPSPSRINSLYLMKSLYSPRIKHIVFNAGSLDVISSSCSLSRSGRLSKRAILVVVNSIMHSNQVRIGVHQNQEFLTCMCQCIFHLRCRVSVIERNTNGTHSCASKEYSNVLFAISTHNAYPIPWTYTIFQHRPCQET